MEVISMIVDILASPQTGAQPLTLDDASHYPSTLPKPRFDGLRGLSYANRMTREIVSSAWFRTLYVRQPEDWEIAISMKICACVL
ncbi:hypothetical protein FRC12_017701, partial [Ceratobasidium sp. 428]